MAPCPCPTLYILPHHQLPGWSTPQQGPSASRQVKPAASRRPPPATPYTLHPKPWTLDPEPQTPAAAQALGSSVQAFLQQQGSRLVLTLLAAAGDSCPAQLLRPVSLLLHALLAAPALGAGRAQLLGQLLALPEFPGVCLADP